MKTKLQWSFLLLFIGVGVSLVGSFAVAPLAQAVLLVAGNGVGMAGLYLLYWSDVHVRYFYGMLAAMGGLACSVLNYLFRGELAMLVILAAASVFSLLEIYLVCTASSQVLAEKNHPELTAAGNRAWKLYTASTVVSFALVVLLYAAADQLGEMTVYVLTVFSTMLSLLAAVEYLSFLWRGYYALKSGTGILPK